MKRKFNRDLRDYLLQECHLPEAGIWGKKSKVAEAGVQEDGTHAIEDFLDYFGWRLGAAKAIFYLGDEALEGGGGSGRLWGENGARGYCGC